MKDRFVVSAPVAGFVRRIPLDVGDRVKRGQVVAQLEPLRSTVLDPRSRAEAEVKVKVAKAALDAAKENARVATASDRITSYNVCYTKLLRTDTGSSCAAPAS